MWNFKLTKLLKPICEPLIPISCCRLTAEGSQVISKDRDTTPNFWTCYLFVCVELHVSLQHLKCNWNLRQTGDKDSCEHAEESFRIKIFAGFLASLCYSAFQALFLFDSRLEVDGECEMTRWIGNAHLNYKLINYKY